jgi:hypothetical protein
MQERRKEERYRSNLTVRWESLMAEGRGEICDLSAGGCFVLSAGSLKVNELVRLEIKFPNHMLYLWGNTVYSIPEMGFAVRFVFSEESEPRAVRKLIDRLKQSQEEEPTT